MKNSWKRTAAFAVSLMMAAGTVAASTGAVISIPAITAYAEEEAEFNWNTLCKELSAAEDGAVVSLVHDITATGGLTIPAGKNVVLDLSGNTLNANGRTIGVSGTLTIIDSSEAKTGKIQTQGATIINVSGGTLNINGGTYNGSTRDQAVFGFNGSISVINFNDGEINTSGSNAFSLRGNTGDLNLNGGVINCTSGSTYPYTSSCVLTGSGYKGKITLNGTECNTDNGSGIYNQGSNNVTIELIKGSITTGENGYAIYAKGATEVIVSGDPVLNTKMNVITASFPAIAPTYEAPGRIAYYMNSNGEKFSDKNLTQPLTGDTAIPQLRITQQLTSDGTRMILRLRIPREEGTTANDYTALINDESTAIDWTNPDCGVINITSPAKNMGDSSDLQIKKGDKQLLTGEDRLCSVSKYLYAVIDNDEYSVYRSTARAMLRYGAAAQVYFGYKDDSLVNMGDTEASLKTVDSIPAVDCKTFTAKELNDALSLEFSSYKGMNMNFAADNSFYMAFAVKNGADAVTAMEEIEAKLSSNDFTAAYTAENDGRYIMVKVADIPLLKLNDTIFTAGGINISAMQYLAKAEGLGDSDKALRDLCKSLYGFYIEAKKFHETGK